MFFSRRNCCLFTFDFLSCRLGKLLNFIRVFDVRFWKERLFYYMENFKRLPYYVKNFKKFRAKYSHEWLMFSFCGKLTSIYMGPISQDSPCTKGFFRHLFLSTHFWKPHQPSRQWNINNISLWASLLLSASLAPSSVAKP